MPSLRLRLRRPFCAVVLASLGAVSGGCFLYGLPPDPPIVESALLREYIRERTDPETGQRHVTLRLPLTPNDTLVARFTHLPGPDVAVGHVEVDGAPRVVVNDSLTLGYNDGQRMRPAMMMRVLDAQRIVVDIPKPRYDTNRVRLDVTQRAVFRAFVSRMMGTARKDLAKSVSRQL